MKQQINRGWAWTAGRRNVTEIRIAGRQQTTWPKFDLQVVEPCARSSKSKAIKQFPVVSYLVSTMGFSTRATSRPWIWRIRQLRFPRVVVVVRFRRGGPICPKVVSLDSLPTIAPRCINRIKCWWPISVSHRGKYRQVAGSLPVRSEIAPQGSKFPAAWTRRYNASAPENR